MKAFILAGGFATRLWPLTEKRAKPLLPLAGKPLIDHLIEKIPSGIPITVSTNAAFGENFEQWKRKSGRKDIAIVVERANRDTEKLGALGAVAQWITTENIADDILLLTGDNYCGFSLGEFLKAQTPGVPLLAAHDIGSPEKARHFGTVIAGPDGRMVAAFEEKPVHPRSTLVSTGVSVIPAACLPVLVEFAKRKPDNVGGIFEEFLRRNIPVEFRAFREPWFDIGSFEAYLEATRVVVGNRVLKGEGAQCTGTKTEGSVVLGRNSVAAKSELRNVILFEGCRVEDCILEDCILDDRCILTGIDLKRQMLREGTVLRTKD